jgi:hypothetical protein
LFESLGDIGITPVFFDTVYFSDADDATVEGHNQAAGLREFSGTQIRALLANHETVPPWCMREELSGWLVDEQNAGAQLFVSPRCEGKVYNSVQSAAHLGGTDGAVSTATRNATVAAPIDDTIPQRSSPNRKGDNATTRNRPRRPR